MASPSPSPAPSPSPSPSPYNPFFPDNKFKRSSKGASSSPSSSLSAAPSAAASSSPSLSTSSSSSSSLASSADVSSSPSSPLVKRRRLYDNGGWDLPLPLPHPSVTLISLPPLHPPLVPSLLSAIEDKSLHSSLSALISQQQQLLLKYVTAAQLAAVPLAMPLPPAISATPLTLTLPSVSPAASSPPGPLLLPRSDCRVYVGSLDYSIDEAILRTLFAPFNPIFRVDMPRDTNTQRGKGFAFIDLTSPEYVAAAIELFSGVPLAGRPMKVGRPSGVAVTPDVVERGKKLLREMLGERVEELRNPLKNPALLPIPGMAAVGGEGAPSLISPHLSSPPHAPGAQPLIPPSASSPSPSLSTRIYVGSIPYEITEAGVRSIFEPFGRIVSSQMQIDPATNRHKGYCFIDYETEEAAAQAVKEMNGFEVGGRMLKVNHTDRVGGGGGAAGSVAHQMSNNPALAANPAAQAILSQVASTLPSAAAPSLLPSSSLSLSREENIRISSQSQRASLMQKLSLSGKQSPVLLLKNLVTPAEVDDELERDVKYECEKYGPLEGIKIYTDKLLDRVLIYVVYLDQEAAIKAQEALNGRYFGGKIVTATFYPKIKYDANIFTDAE